jgi:sugar phosphate isomerase/epimerase
VLQHLDYLAFIDIYHERIKCFHVKDAELRPNGRSGVYGGYQGWVDRPGRFRSLGDGQVDFTQIFSKMAQYDYEGWAVLEWECALKHPEVGAAEGAPSSRNTSSGPHPTPSTISRNRARIATSTGA